MAEDLRLRYAKAIANAECEQRPRCVLCMTAAVIAVRDEELEQLRATLARVRLEHAAIHAEMDAFARKHEPDCECEVIPATRETADRMLAALDAPQEA